MKNRKNGEKEEFTRVDTKPLEHTSRAYHKIEASIERGNSIYSSGIKLEEDHSSTSIKKAGV